MNHKKILTLILVLALLLPWLPFGVQATGDLGLTMDVTPDLAAIGGNAVVTVSLENYKIASIAGLQVDIENIDPDVLKVVDYRSAIVDSDAASNKVSSKEDAELVRFLYFRTSGTLNAPCKEVMRMTVQINPELTEAGSITLPVTMKIVTVDDRQLTLNSSCTIEYQIIGEDAVAGNGDTGVAYTTLKEALAEAKAGQRVSLLKDCTMGTVAVPADVTLDLNGKVMKADNVVSFGSVVDTAESVGGIQIDIDTTKAFTKLQADNSGYLPVYDTRDGMYKFFAYDVESNKVTAIDGERVVFYNRVVFDKLEGYEVLANTECSGIDFELIMSWTGMTGFDVRYTISDDTLRSYAQAAYDKIIVSGTNTKAITATIKGIGKLGENGWITAAPSVKTVAEVTDSAEELTYRVQRD